ncbi:hypothetical protein FJTKL_01448 [Diaporthe vaccinii]|uniref:Uncharacterized protein n=1 Tax=Diaporthe vaccinii TaxID=105482 RepID=A0ABR4E0D0_9PEZI
MYSDVQELYDGGAADLEQELRRAADGAARSTSSSNNTPQGTTQRQGSNSSSTSSMSGSTLAPRPGANSTPGASGGGGSQSGSISTVDTGPGPQITDRFVLLCVNGPRFPQLRAYIEVRRSYQPSFHPETPTVVKISVGWMYRVWKSSQKLTTEVFKMLRLRWLVWWIGGDVFFVPKSADFVKFEVIPIKENHIPEILESTCLPPEEEVLNKKTYHYAPCPQQVQNPLLQIPWLHILFEPGMHTSDFWTKRTPKKLVQMLSYSSPEPVIGWGVHIVEGPSWHALAVLIIIFGVLSLAISLLYSAVTSDVSSGFALGACFIAAETMMVTWVLAVATTSLRYNK